MGLNGEKLQIFTESGAKKVKWVPGVKDSAVTWYKVKIVFGRLDKHC